MINATKRKRVIAYLLLLVFSCYLAGAAGLSAHFIDVGQGDAILVCTPNGSTLLIDAGPRVAGSTVVEYLKKLGIHEIDVVVATHPHEDHIGGFPAVFESFSVDRVYFTDHEHTTKTYERFLDAVNASGAYRVRAVAGKTIDIDPEVQIEILSPLDKRYRDLNHSSVVLRLTYGKTAFLFTGDMEVLNENELLAEKVAVGADVLKVAHHGSTTSSSMVFLEQVSPTVAVIMCGSGNSYGHPHREVLDRLESLHVEVLRTDLLGTVVIESNGMELTFRSKSGS